MIPLAEFVLERPAPTDVVGDGMPAALQAATRLSIDGAAAMLLTEEPGVRYLRSAAGLRTAPGSVTCTHGWIEALEEDSWAEVRFDARGCTVVPGLVDCHTHLPAPTGEAPLSRPVAELAAAALGHGTTTIELGGTSCAAVERSSVTAQRLVTTLLLAPVAPLDGWADAAERALSATPAGAVAVELLGIDDEQLARIAELVRTHGLLLHLHGAAPVAWDAIARVLESGARSLAHVDRLEPHDLAPLAHSECAVVLLPTAELGGEKRAPLGGALADAGAICALATDAHLGSGPVALQAIAAAVRRYGWSVAEALLAATLNAAYVLGRSSSLGSIEIGKRADLVVLDGPLELLARGGRDGRSPVLAVVVDGRLAWLRADARARVRAG